MFRLLFIYTILYRKEVDEMNFKQLQCAIELAKVRNFSKASEQLDMFQSALSKQIKALENDLGVQLFDRNSNPIELTPAGERFIKEAKELLYKEDKIKRLMDSFKTGEKGRITVGLSPFRSLYIMPEFVKKMRKKFPGVQVFIHDTNNEEVRKEVEEGKLDFAIVNLPVDEAVFEYIKLEPDKLVLAVPNEMMGLITESDAANLSEVDFKDCANLPFVVVNLEKEMGQLFERFCSLAQVSPEIVTEVVGITTAWEMVRNGIGATLLPLQFISDEAFDSANITLLTVKNNIFNRQPVIITRLGQHLSEYAQYAINILKNESQK